jgi:cytosine/adenosine deaminase-related metal-dependent hydrolase
MFMTACEAARETGCLFHFHWAEFPADQELRDWRQNSFSDAMRSSGICQVNALAAHGVNLSARDWANIHDWDLRVALCARSNVALSVGLPRVPEFCRGTTTRFGTDGSHDAPVDIFQSAKPLTGLNEDAGVPWSYNSVLHTALATADRLGFRHPIGKLAPGYLADIVTIKPGPGAQADIASGGTLDVSALDWDGSVCDVWVGGVRVVAAGQVLTFDTEATYARLALIRRRLLATG